MSSVASDPTSIFPASRPLPGNRTAAPDSSGQGTEQFAALLDHEPAPQPRAKHSDNKRRDDAAPSEGSRRSHASKNAKDPKGKADAKIDEKSGETTQPQVQSEETSKDAAAADATKNSAEGAGEKPAEAQPDATETDTAALEGAALTEAATDALFAPAAVQAPAATIAIPAAATVDVAAAIVPGAPLATPVVVPAVAAPEAIQGPAPAGTEVLAAAANAAKPAPAAAAEVPKGETAPATAKPAQPAGPALPQAEVPAAARAAAPATPAAAKPEVAADASIPDSNGALKIAGDVLQNLGLTVPAAPTGVAPMQSTAAASAAAAAAPAQAFNTPVPVAGLAVELAAQALAGKHRFEIRLDPPELGRIDVRLEIDRDGNVSSRLVVERAETLDMLRRDAPQLERALQQAGLKTSDNALEFSLRDQAPHRDDEARQSARLVVPDEGAATLDTIQHNYGRLLGLGGGLDIRV